MKTQRLMTCSLLALGAFAFLSGTAAAAARAASDYLLQIDGIDGESSDARHKGEIEIESFSFGATAPAEAGRAGKVTFQDLHFNKRIDKSSPLLMKACATGQHIKQATLTVRKAGGEQQEYLKITIKDVIITSYSLGGTQSSGSLPFDQFAVSFSEITTSYSPQKPDGSLDVPVVFSGVVKDRR